MGRSPAPAGARPAPPQLALFPTLLFPSGGSPGTGGPNDEAAAHHARSVAARLRRTARSAQQEVAFQDSVAALQRHREFQAMQAEQAQRAQEDSTRRMRAREAVARDRAVLRAVREEHERWRRCVLVITKDSLSNGEPSMETASSDEVRARCGDPR